MVFATIEKLRETSSLSLSRALLKFCLSFSFFPSCYVTFFGVQRLFP